MHSLLTFCWCIVYPLAACSAADLGRNKNVESLLKKYRVRKTDFINIRSMDLIIVESINELDNLVEMKEYLRKPKRRAEKGDPYDTRPSQYISGPHYLNPAFYAGETMRKCLARHHRDTFTSHIRY